eukprot:1136635-Pelagomonas_calceolata.AAC.6
MQVGAEVGVGLAEGHLKGTNWRLFGLISAALFAVGEGQLEGLQGQTVRSGLAYVKKEGQDAALQGSLQNATAALNAAFDLQSNGHINQPFIGWRGLYFSVLQEQRGSLQTGVELFTCACFCCSTTCNSCFKVSTSCSDSTKLLANEHYWHPSQAFRSCCFYVAKPDLFKLPESQGKYCQRFSSCFQKFYHAQLCSNSTTLSKVLRADVEMSSFFLVNAGPQSFWLHARA